MVKIVIATPDDIPVIQRIAQKTWHYTYEKLLSPEQLAYMLQKIYSTQALLQVMDDGSQVFLVLSDEKGPQGFAAYGIRSENKAICKLHKLYVMPENHGKGYGRNLIGAVVERIKPLGASLLDLNVKKDNPSKSFYERLGFRVIAEEDIPFGPYLLQDYVMQLAI